MSDRTKIFVGNRRRTRPARLELPKEILMSQDGEFLKEIFVVLEEFGNLVIGLREKIIAGQLHSEFQLISLRPIVDHLIRPFFDGSQLVLGSFFGNLLWRRNSPDFDQSIVRARR